jgi:pimeloyl-ACP methyl ester carboxylesterase
MDAYACSIPASRAFMSRLLMNLATNIQRYPEWIAYLKDRQPKTLIVWGRNDPLMRPAADLRFFDASHFALDENADAIAEAIIQTYAGDVQPAGALPRDSRSLRSPREEYSS